MICWFGVIFPIFITCMLTRCLHHDAWPCSQSVAIWTWTHWPLSGHSKVSFISILYERLKHLNYLLELFFLTNRHIVSILQTYQLIESSVWMISLGGLLHLRKKICLIMKNVRQKSNTFLGIPLILQKCNKWHIWMHFSSCFDGSHEDIP